MKKFDWVPKEDQLLLVQHNVSKLSHQMSRDHVFSEELEAQLYYVATQRNNGDERHPKMEWVIVGEIVGTHEDALAFKDAIIENKWRRTSYRLIAARFFNPL